MPKEERSSRRGARVQAYRVDADVIAELARIAAEEDVTTGRLANGLLRYALGEAAAGRIRLEKRPTNYAIVVFNRSTP